MNLIRLFLLLLGVMCPTLEPPLDGSVRINSPLVNGTALYFCKSGFMRNGSTSRRCDSTGKWTGSAPVCDREL